MPHLPEPYFDPILRRRLARRSGRRPAHWHAALPAGGTLSVSVSDLAFEPVKAIANRPRLVELARQFVGAGGSASELSRNLLQGFGQLLFRLSHALRRRCPGGSAGRRGAFGIGSITHLSRAVAHTARDLLARDFPGRCRRLTRLSIRRLRRGDLLGRSLQVVDAIGELVFLAREAPPAVPVAGGRALREA